MDTVFELFRRRCPWNIPISRLVSLESVACSVVFAHRNIYDIDSFFPRTHAVLCIVRQQINVQLRRLLRADAQGRAVGRNTHIANISYLRLFDETSLSVLIDEPEFVGEPVDEQPTLIVQWNEHGEELVLILSGIHRHASSYTNHIACHQIQSPPQIIVLHNRQT